MIKKSLLSIVYLLIHLFLFSQEKGNYFIKNYSPHDYKAHIQNWDITQTNNGIILIGNGDGIIYFDGNQYNMIQLPNKTTVRSFYKTPDGKIFIGSVGHFGFLSADSIGRLKYFKLSNSLDSINQHFFDIWGIEGTKDDIYFRATNLIFRYNLKSKKIETIKAITRHAYHFKLNNQIYVKESRDGIYKLENDTLTALKNSKSFRSIPFVHAYNLSKDTIIVPTKRGLYYIYLKNKTLRHQKIISSNPQLIRNSGIYSITADINNIYLGTELNGVIILDKKANIKGIINKQNGLAKGAVYSEFIDKDGNLWLAMSNGFSFVNLNSSVSFWDERNGIEATVEDIIRYNNQIYIGSHQDFYRIDKNNNIQLVGDVKTQTWDFDIFKIPNKKDSILLAASSLGLHQILKNNTLKDIFVDKGTIFSIYQWKKRPEIVFLGQGNGLMAIRYNKGKWIFEKNFTPISDNIRAIQEDSLGNLWLGTFRNGAIKIQFQDTTLNIANHKYYNTQNGFLSTKNVLVYPINHGLVFTCDKGIYQYNAKKDSMEIAHVFGIPADEKHDIFDFQQVKNKVYISGLYNKNSPLGIGKFNGSTYDWDFTSAAAIPNMMMLGMYCDEDGKAWFGGSEGLYLYNPNKKTKNARASALITSISLENDSSIFMGFFTEQKDSQLFSIKQSNEQIPILKYANNALTFKFNSTIYNFRDKVQYSFRLLGYNKKWSKWINEHKKQYNNLFSGDYTFEVRAKDIYGNISSSAKFSFTIKPPFYFTIYAFILFFILFLLLIWLVIYLYSLRLIKQKQTLERIVEERTHEIREKNEEITLQNAELYQAKEEIMAQAELLEETNKELEKLSIVASQTSNAVLIFDKDFNLEWANPSFTKIYGYTYQEYIKKFGKNILQLSTNERIKETINQCISTGKYAHYESLNFRKDDSKIWMQVSLSPIVDEKGTPIKLIAIESDISNLKLAEEEIKLQNEEIKSQNEQLLEIKTELEIQRDYLTLYMKQIEGSIKYALTIQQAMLPSKHNMDLFFDNFILYLPKDIVSGDFFWFNKVPINKNSEYIYTAVVDCTGHGVPGAFMSMIGMRLLSEIVNERKILLPSKILTELDVLVKKALKQNESDNNDGMDMSIIRFKSENGVIKDFTYSGAKRPILHYENRVKKLNYIEATRKSIGGAIFNNSLSYIDTYITVNKGDIIYQYSDGFIDQNTNNRKRFGTPRFLNLIKKIIDKDFNIHQNILMAELKSFMKKEVQRDDITVLGLKIK